MTRGRKKDHTIPPSRALAVQRDYRARKAQYVSDLEERCKAAEEDNVRLRQELEVAKMGSPSIHAEMARASTELMQNLVAATASLTKFQKLSSSSVPSSNLPTQPLELQAASFPSPVPSSHSPHTEPSSPAALCDNTIDCCAHHHSHDSHNRHEGHLISTQRPSRHTPSPSPSLGSHCCGGYMDCRDLVEEEEDELETENDESLSMSITRTSGIRFTADEGMHKHRLPRS